MLVLFILSVLLFAWLRALPGGPVSALLGDRGTAESRAQLREELGLDEPIFVQYFSFLGRALTGNFGNSTGVTPGTPALEVFLERFPATLELSFVAIVLALITALLDPNFGMSLAFNAQVLAQDWLGDPSLALYVVVFVIAWQFVPFHTLLYQAGVRQIPVSLYEAAQLDGAGRIRQFFHITLPQLRYTIITSSTLMLVGSLTYFDLVFVLTGGGPGEATRMLPLDMYLTGFSSNEMGKASTLAVLLVVTGLALALGLSRWASFRRGSQLEGA